jgi:hypothetical protein
MVEASAKCKHASACNEEIDDALDDDTDMEDSIWQLIMEQSNLCHVVFGVHPNLKVMGLGQHRYKQSEDLYCYIAITRNSM